MSIAPISDNASAPASATAPANAPISDNAIASASATAPASADASAAAGDLRERARRAIAEQPSRTVTVLSSLLAAHDELGYLPYEAVEEAARSADASVNEAWSVASFYPNFRFTPPPRHSVEVCWGPTCHVLGAQPILQGLARHLGLDGEGDAEDGSVSLKFNTCLGVCPHAPAMSFDHELAGRMSLDAAVGRLERVRSGERAG